jgi:hypothetical protein
MAGRRWRPQDLRPDRRLLGECCYSRRPYPSGIPVAKSPWTSNKQRAASPPSAIGAVSYARKCAMRRNVSLPGSELTVPRGRSHQRVVPGQRRVPRTVRPAARSQVAAALVVRVTPASPRGRGNADATARRGHRSSNRRFRGVSPSPQSYELRPLAVARGPHDDRDRRICLSLARCRAATPVTAAAETSARATRSERKR